MTMKNVNYTPEVTQAIVESYETAPNMDTVRNLADIYGKTVKSIIGKLSREGVYQKDFTFIIDSVSISNTSFSIS